jgi:hypothetical protein
MRNCWFPSQYCWGQPELAAKLLVLTKCITGLVLRSVFGQDQKGS